MARIEPPPFRQVVAIVQDCLRAYANVTDAKDAALRAFARRRLEVDTQTVNRAIDAALSQRVIITPATPPRKPDGRVDWIRLGRILTDAGLLPKAR